MSVHNYFGSGVRLADVTKSDSTIVDCAALYVGGTGDVAILASGDTVPVTLKAVPVGTVLRIACKKVMSTNTTATLLVAIYAA